MKAIKIQMHVKVGNYFIYSLFHTLWVSRKKKLCLKINNNSDKIEVFFVLYKKKTQENMIN